MTNWPIKKTEASLAQLEEIWLGHARIDGQKFILVMKDLEDLECFPVYFKTEAKMNEYRSNIISESKVKVIKVLEINEGDKA